MQLTLSKSSAGKTNLQLGYGLVESQSFHFISGAYDGNDCPQRTGSVAATWTSLTLASYAMNLVSPLHTSSTRVLIGVGSNGKIDQPCGGQRLHLVARKHRKNHPWNSCLGPNLDNCCSANLVCLERVQH